MVHPAVVLVVSEASSQEVVGRPGRSVEALSISLASWLVGTWYPSYAATIPWPPVHSVKSHVVPVSSAMCSRSVRADGM